MDRERKFQSDVVVGMRYFTAVAYIENNDLWDEVLDLVVDCYGFVEKVLHMTTSLD